MKYQPRISYFRRKVFSHWSPTIQKTQLTCFQVNFTATGKRSNTIAKTMGDYFDALHFAQDLMMYAFEVQSIPFDTILLDDFYEGNATSPFNETIGKAVLAIICHRHVDIRDCIRDLIDLNAKNATLYSRYAIEAVPEYFPEGYTPERFLCFCAMMIGVGRQLFEYPNNGIPVCSHEIIGTVLTGHILTGEFVKQGGYERLTEISEAIVERLLDLDVEECSCCY